MGDWYLSDAMSGIVPSLWQKRNDVENPCRDYIDGDVVGSVDTVPIRVYYPTNREYSRAFFQPKYAEDTSGCGSIRSANIYLRTTPRCEF